ncbi:DUF167 domain-containing protein [Desulfovermiculus halophilus]|jgi:hypothetical protein|uniref:DUF167 domain-containing protein n=1 Tax=Desulfovermiculus halophilus TaxID=339722 RepID=UPI0006845FAF|nr:DUF167 domain-containing protein [Desulfovermiculus halophilus]
MEEAKECISCRADRCLVRLWVQPGAKKNELGGFYQGCLKVRLKAPPVDNKANQELAAFLARLLGVKPRQIQLISGQRSRKKIISIQVDAYLNAQRIRAVLDPE